MAKSPLVDDCLLMDIRCPSNAIGKFPVFCGYIIFDTYSNGILGLIFSYQVTFQV